mmetsp:Transcript_43702/g.126183  ORF Transcript_43702/g.126183 Transcript_43702/m.126183 type:complete len:448 (+) Transcript_43702:65-1408(+)
MSSVIEEQPLPRAVCTCDECGRKEALLEGLEHAGALAEVGPSGLPIVDELRGELIAHRRRAALAPQNNEATGDRLSIRKTNPKRPWLTYDPDMLLPSPFDAFLLGGGCPQIRYPPASGNKHNQHLPLEVSLCYIVGCGRSGTTVLSELLSRYVGVVFLNEPRQLWIPLMPSMDIWSVAAPSRQGRLSFDTEEALLKVDERGDQTVAELMMDAYTDIADIASSPPPQPGQISRTAVVVEKFPEHAFRLPFLASMCQDALGPSQCTFLHLIRDGVDVARSISAFENPAVWYGVKDEWKWQCLRELCFPNSGPGDRKVPPVPACQLDLGDDFVKFLDMPRTDQHCRFARGLVEWAASVLAARNGAKQAEDSSTWLEIRYEELTSKPAQVLATLTRHLHLEPSASARQRAKTMLMVKPSQPLSAVERKVLQAVRGSRVEELLREFGRELPS